MRQILEAVQKTHSLGIFHRDLKLGNILINQENEIQIVDWGLAEFYRPGQEYNIRVSTRPYKPPEILMGLKQYDYSFDMWNIGCVFFCLLFRQLHFIYGKDNNE